MILIKEKEIISLLDEMRNDKNLETINKIDAFTEICQNEFLMENDLIQYMQQSHNVKLARNAAEGVLKRMDTNFDGKVNYYDFLTFLAKPPVENSPLKSKLKV